MASSNRLILRQALDALNGQEVRPDIYAAAVAWALGAWRDYDYARQELLLDHGQALAHLEATGRHPDAWPGWRLYAPALRGLARRHAVILARELLPPPGIEPRAFGKVIRQLCEGKSAPAAGRDPFD